MKRIYVPLGEEHYVESVGFTISPAEYSQEFIKAIEDETKTACDECVLSYKPECQRFECCFEERKDKISVYFKQVFK